MRLTVFLVLVMTFPMSASVWSQSMSVKLKKATLKELFTEIEKKSDYRFFYSDDEVDVNQRVSVNLTDQSIAEILDVALENLPYSFKETDNKLILIESKTDGSESATMNSQQQKSVSGKVTDVTGASLPAVTVVLKGTTTGVITDNSGNYSISVPENATLQFSFVGMKTQELAVGDKTTINVVLIEDAIGIEEVVAVGYGTARKSDLTGSIATLNVNQNTIREKPVSTIDQKLIGQIAGVQIQQGSGAPGAGTSMRIRGAGSLGAGNDPLYVVDGMPYSSGTDQKLNPLIGLNPNDIESITVLKDASSTAIYGSRGANGVVMITTKKGALDHTEVSVSAMAGVQQVPDKGRPNMMNQEEFADMQREKIGILVRAFEKREPTSADYPVAYLPENLNGPGTDWYDGLLQNAVIQDYNISVSKGAKDSRINFSLGYYSQEGVLKYTGMERFSGKLTMESDIGKSVTIGATFLPSLIDQNRTHTNSDRLDVVGLAIWANPVMTPYDSNGKLKPYIQSPVNKYSTAWSFPNPYYVLEQNIESQKNFRNLGIAYIEWEIIKGLKAKSSLNTDFTSSTYFQYIPSTIGQTNLPPTAGTGRSVTDRGNSLNWVFENTLNYEKSIKKHRINSVLGFTTQKFSADNINLIADPYSNDLIHTINAAQAIKTWGQTINEWSMTSFLGRINYSFDEKYLLTATVRSDGSSRFGEEKRFATFPSIAGAWRISEENFLKGNKVVDNLKLRVSYGVSGNNNIGNYSHLASINSGAYIFGSTLVTASSVGISNPYLTWEGANQVDAGLDFGFMKGRLSFVVDYYNRKTIDMLLNDVIPATTGFTTQTVNKGNVRNSGFEFGITGTPIEGKFNWDVNLNIAFNSNEILSLNDNNDRILSGNSDGGYSHISVVGKPIAQFFGFVFDGIYSAEDMLNPAVPKDPWAREGSTKYKDLDGDGKVTGTLDFGIIGNPYPDFLFGFTNNFEYKNFDLSVVLNGQYGGDVMNGLRYTINNTHAFFNVGKEYTNRWRSAADPGDGRHYGVAAYAGGVGHVRSDLWIEDASYLRISNLKLGYSFPKGLMKESGFIANCRLYFTIENLATFTSYSGANPEGQSVTQSTTLAPGFDMSSYPLARTAAFGVNITF